MEFHRNTVKSLDLNLTESIKTKEKLCSSFVHFIKEFKTTHKSYHISLNSNITQGINTLQINLEHLSAFDEDLFNEIINDPENLIQMFEKEICRIYSVSSFQILIESQGTVMKIRELSSGKSNRIIRIQGIVISTSHTIAKPRELFLTCRNCLNNKRVTDAIPRSCDNSACPIDPYTIIPEKSDVVDIQYAKIQENFEDIPTGETPRHFSLILEGSLVNSISPGNQVKITGIYTLRSNKDGATSYIKVLGLENTKNKIKSAFSEEQELQFKEMARGNIYEDIVKSIAPSIYGHEDVKKALACMLFGGTRRVREDGICLRGDINVLLLGDPGIAKSQLLKFIEILAPISVYTSGRGSSAAGLTASVIKDRNNDFYLEGGALVLADNGICCIDEFDKMNESDRVSIHEAMEQQTISIAKAGITTVLNTRTSILAAANPVFGRYDDYKTPGENIEFGSTILSRFDCIFIIKDKSGPMDRKMAEHVLKLHDSKEDIVDVIIGVETLRNYIQYAKSKITPVLTEGAMSKLNTFYVSIRQEANSYETVPKKNFIPITVRQLEAIIRLSESLARMELRSTVTTKHVDEAIRLFQASTMNAVAQGHSIEGMVRPSFFEEVEKVMNKIVDVMPVGTSKKYSELASILHVAEPLLKKGIDAMVKQHKLISKDFGRTFLRLP